MFEGILQPIHLLLIFGIALLMFGRQKLPQLGRGLGEAIGGFREGIASAGNKAIEDAAAQSFPKMYVDLRTAYAVSSVIGDLVAARTVQLFPDKFPGDAASKAADIRVSLNSLLQEHSYLATMTTDAAAAARATEQNGAAGALSSNADALGKLFADTMGAGAGTQVAQLWGARNSDLIAYATSGDATARQNLTETFITKFYGLAPNASDSVREQALATIKVIDDQRGKNFKVVAGDDRAAAAAMQAVADHIA